MSPPTLRVPPVTSTPRLALAPELAEEIAWRAILRAEQAGRPELRARHHERGAAAYLLPPGSARDRAFAELARQEVEELDLLAPVRAAVLERPLLAGSIDLVLLSRALGPSDETVTCDPASRRLGLRATPDRFVDPIRLRAWARHAFGHAEDSLDPSFGFEPGWERSVDPATAERLHVLWDASIDGRAAEAGRPVVGVSRDVHLGRLVGLLPPGGARTAAVLVERCWSGPRPDFETLRRWAEAPHDAGDSPPDRKAAPVPHEGRCEPTLLPGRRCPLCRFPSAVLLVPSGALAASIARAHPGWQPEAGVCERCSDRYRLAPSAPSPTAAGAVLTGDRR